MNPNVASPARLATFGLLASSCGFVLTELVLGPGWIGALLAWVVVVEAELMWRIVAEDRRYRWGRVRRVLFELTALFVVAAVASALASGRPMEVIADWPGDFVTVRSVGFFLLAVAMWASVTASLDDLARLGELSESMEVEYLPLPRLRWRWLGWLVVLVAAGSVSLSGWAALVELSRPMTSGLIWPALVYLPIGIIALGRAAQHDARRRWEAAHVRLDGYRAAGAVVLLAVVAVLAVLAVPTADGAPVLRAVGAGFRGIGRVGQWVLDWIASRTRRRDDEGTDLAPDQSVDTPLEIAEPDVSEIAPGEPIFDESTVELVGDVVFWAFVSLVVVVAVWLLIRLGRDLHTAGTQRQRHARSRWWWLRVGLDSLARLFGALVRRITKPGRSKVSPDPRTQPSSDLAPAPVAPTSVVVRILEAYRGLVDDLRTWVRPRGRAETVQEYRRRVMSSIPEVARETSDLTRVVEAARYRRETVGEAAADEAEQLLASARSKLDGRRSRPD